MLWHRGDAVMYITSTYLNHGIGKFLEKKFQRKKTKFREFSTRNDVIRTFHTLAPLHRFSLERLVRQTSSLKSERENREGVYLYCIFLWFLVFASGAWHIKYCVNTHTLFTVGRTEFHLEKTIHSVYIFYVLSVCLKELFSEKLWGI